MATMDEIIKHARQLGVSDIHFTALLPPIFRLHGSLVKSEYPIQGDRNREIILSIMNEEQKKKLQTGQEVDFCYATPEGYRHRVNVYWQQNEITCALRILNDKIPNFESLFLPPIIEKLAREPRGLILVTGPTGSGKSTTLAAMIDYMNTLRRQHIITVEDPIEYVHQHKNSVIHQREVGDDTQSFASALRGALREDPDIILVGEMRDYETVGAAVTAAETGHLVLSTLHTTGAASTIDRIIDVFPPHNQQQVRTQLGSILRGVVTQTLVPLIDGSGRRAAHEILIGTDAVLSVIRENKCHQLNSMMQTGSKDGMITLNASLANLVKAQLVDYNVAFNQASDKSEFQEYFSKY